jgi:hypothetical protein
LVDPIIDSGDERQRSVEWKERLDSNLNQQGVQAGGIEGSRWSNFGDA